MNAAEKTEPKSGLGWGLGVLPLLLNAVVNNRHGSIAEAYSRGTRPRPFTSSLHGTHMRHFPRDPEASAGFLADPPRPSRPIQDGEGGSEWTLQVEALSICNTSTPICRTVCQVSASGRRDPSDDLSLERGSKLEKKTPLYLYSSFPSRKHQTPKCFNDGVAFSTCLDLIPLAALNH